MFFRLWRPHSGESIIGSVKAKGATLQFRNIGRVPSESSDRIFNAPYSGIENSNCRTDFLGYGDLDSADFEPDVGFRVARNSATLYTSLKTGPVTTSVALKRLVGFSAKNRFYRANRELGRIFKTEFILQYPLEPELRRIRRGLLKVEQLHALAIDVFYGRRGQI
jgi:hypothetical protein